MPIDIKLDDPTGVYSLIDTIRSKIFDFNKLIRNLDVKAFAQNNSILPCSCEDSDFIDKDHQNILTGDLLIIKNSKLRKLFAKGPKHMVKNTISWEEAKTSIMAGLDDCIDIWSQTRH